LSRACGSYADKLELTPSQEYEGVAMMCRTTVARRSTSHSRLLQPKSR